MYELLEKFMKSNALIAIYTDTNDYEVFEVGYVYRLCADKIIVLNVGVHGEFDGYSVLFVDDIYRIEENSQYLQKIEKLKDWNVSEVFGIDGEEEYFKAVTDTALKARKIIAISCCNSQFEVMGYVKEFSDTVVRVLQITKYGEADGETVIRTDDINGIVIADIECEEADRLYRLKR